MGVRRFLQPFLQRLEDNRPGEMRKLVHGLCGARTAQDLSLHLMAIDCCYAKTSGAQVQTAEKFYLSILSVYLIFVSQKYIITMAIPF